MPYINSKNDTFLKENMVIANEPGIYIPGKYGVRIEDTILVEKNGCRVLTRLTKKLCYNMTWFLLENIVKYKG